MTQMVRIYTDLMLMHTIKKSVLTCNIRVIRVL